MTRPPEPHRRREPRRRAPRTVRALVVAGLACCSLWGCSAAIDPVAIQDAQTAVRVKTALVNDPDIGTRTIEVHVDRGIVRLSGQLSSEAERARAVDLARSVEGVRGVQPAFSAGQPSSPPDAADADGRDRRGASSELEARPGLLAIGGSIGWSRPSAEALESRVAFSPLLKLGSGRGLGPAIAFDWFRAELRPPTGAGAGRSRVRVRPVMLGVSYTLARDRVSVAPSIVAGWAFNSLTVTETGLAAGVPVEVENGPAWRVGASAWYDVTRRLAVYVSGGYLLTNLRLTVVEGGRFERRDRSGNTATTHVGLAYRVF